MEFISLKVDEKGRLHLPKPLREELGIEDHVLAEKHEGYLEIKPTKKSKDPLTFLTSLNFKTRKTPLEMKKEAQKAMTDAL